MGIGDFFKKQRYRIWTEYNGAVINKLTAPVRGQTSIYRKKQKMAYLIPDNINPVRDGNFHHIEYDIRDATPLSDIMEIAPDLVRELEKQITRGYIEAIDLTLQDPNATLTEDQKLELKTARDWLNAYYSVCSGVFYNLWRWGYIKAQNWYKNLTYIPAPEQFILPKKLARVGLRPGYLYERENSEMVRDIIKRQEPKWAWLGDVLVPLIVGVVLIVIVWLLVTHA